MSQSFEGFFEPGAFASDHPEEWLSSSQLDMQATPDNEQFSKASTDDLTGKITPEMRAAILKRVKEDRLRPVLGLDYLQGSPVATGRPQPESWPADHQYAQLSAGDQMGRPLNRGLQGVTGHAPASTDEQVLPTLPRPEQPYREENLSDELFGGDDSEQDDRGTPTIAERRLPRLMRNWYAGALAVGLAVAPFSYNYAKEGELIRNPVTIAREAPDVAAKNLDFYLNEDGWKPNKLVSVYMARFVNDTFGNNKDSKGESDGNQAQ